MYTMYTQMPVMDGIEATRRYRAHEQHLLLTSTTPTTPPTTATSNTTPTSTPTPYSPQIIIGCSANSDDDTHREAMQVGMNAFLCKPMSIKSLHDIIIKLRFNIVKEIEKEEEKKCNEKLSDLHLQFNSALIWP